MHELPILFSAPMLRAILALLKRMTRRQVNKLLGFGPITEFCPSDTPGYNWHFRNKRGCWNDISHARLLECCPYGKVGDRLSVKETFWAFGLWETRFNPKKGRDEWHFVDLTLESAKSYRYAASDIVEGLGKRRGGVTPQWWKRPAIFMSRRASRITLEVTGVRVERLHDIKDGDCWDEGLESWLEIEKNLPRHNDGTPAKYISERQAFSYMWNQINGAGSWDANPWVWVVEFKRVEV